MDPGRVARFEPDDDWIVTGGGKTITYDDLVVTLGIQLDWGKVAGLKETLGKNGVTSNYSYDIVEYTWELIDDFTGGDAIFTQPSTPIKCAGAPQKIMYLAEEHFRRKGVRKKSNVRFATAGAGMFGVPKYKKTLDRIVKERDIQPHFGHDLVAIDGKKREATFKVATARRA